MSKLYNQNNYPSSPYPSPSKKDATIKSGGCGVCSSANVLSFYGIAGYDPIKLADVFIKRGARVDGGTNMGRASEIVCEIGKLSLITTNDESRLVSHLKSGGIAIANVDGDNGAKGIFSNAGHYINIIGYDNKSPRPFIVFDVGYYNGKFDGQYRKQYVTVATLEGNAVEYCNQECLNIDTRDRVPNYYLFSKKGDEINMEELKKLQQQVADLVAQVSNLTKVVGKLANPVLYNSGDKTMPEWAMPVIKKLVDKGYLKGNEKGELDLTESELRQFVVNDRVGIYGK